MHVFLYTSCPDTLYMYIQCFFWGGRRRGTRTPKHFVNLTGESKNFNMLDPGPAFGWGGAGPLPQALTSRGRRKGSHRPATRQYVAL
jgi:hypothetical protein